MVGLHTSTLTQNSTLILQEGGGGLGWWGGGGDSAGRLFYGDGGRERLWASLKSDLKSDIHCLNNHLTLIGGFFKKRYIIA